MTAWTYATSPVNGIYWQSGGTDVVLIQYPSGRLEWRRVDDGRVHLLLTDPYHMGKRLDPQYYPPWYLDMDDYGMDVGL